MLREAVVNEWIVALVDAYRLGDGGRVLQSLAEADEEEDLLLITVEAFLMTMASVVIREVLSRSDSDEGSRSLAVWTHGVAAGRSGIRDLPIREWAGVICFAAGDLNAGIPTDTSRRVALFATLLSMFSEDGESALLPYQRLRQESVNLSEAARLHLENTQWRFGPKNA